MCGAGFARPAHTTQLLYAVVNNSNVLIVAYRVARVLLVHALSGNRAQRHLDQRAQLRAFRRP